MWHVARNAERFMQRRTVRRISTALLVHALATHAVGCGGSEPRSVSTANEPGASASLPACTPGTSSIAFTRAPSGAREVDPAWLAAHRCEVHIVDVRAREELGPPLGHVAGAEWVPLDRLEAQAASWASEQPVVLVDRSGRRATTGAARLEALGIHEVASLTGGMLAWTTAGWPVEQTVPPEAPNTPVPSAGSTASSPARAGGDPVRERLEDPARIEWISVASMIGPGAEHCIDGRAGGPVVGTPGGDAGELTLALGAVEHTARAEVALEAVDHLVARYATSFGRFYLHTDESALGRLEATLSTDPRFASIPDTVPVATLVQHPPRELEDALASLLAQPEHVGCGHLRLLLEHPEEYGVRRELTEAVIRETHLLRFRRPELVDYEVLEGEHEERAVVQVLLDRPVHAYSRVPTFPYREGDPAAFFVSHPEVSAYLRAELGSFLVDHEPALALAAQARRRRPLDRRALDHELAALADRQIRATLRHLARELPVYEVHMRAPGGDVDELLPVVSGPNASLGCRSY
jgi:rhodanese-related sulfurtransferase